MKNNPLEVVLALGSGAAGGLAHIGIIRTLERHGVVVRGIAGTSIGAIIGGLHSAGQLEPYESYIRKLDARGMLRLLDPIIPRSGLLGGRRVIKRLIGFVGDARIEELPLPFCAIATNLDSGAEVVLDQGNLVEALRASFAIPGVFTPWKLGDCWLIDGGVSNPVPIHAARKLVPDLPVVAVDLNNNNQLLENGASSTSAGNTDHEIGRIERLLRKMAGGKEGRPSLLSSISGSMTHMEHRISSFQIAEEEPELLLEPAVCGVGVFDFHRAAPIIAAGEACARRAIENGELDQLIAKARRARPRRG